MPDDLPSAPAQPDPEPRLVDLGRPRAVWAIGAIHGRAGALAQLHQAIWPRLEPGDRLVYLGDAIGVTAAAQGGDAAATIDQLLAIRAAVIARPGFLVDDVVFLRGRQEEMLQKLERLQFAPSPGELLRWMAENGIEPTLAAYGLSLPDGLGAAREGTLALHRWTARLRDAVQARPGHAAYAVALRRAAFVAGGLLLVSAGLDPDRPLAAQGDRFWWDGAGFDRLAGPYPGFALTVRGFDPADGGVAQTGWSATLHEAGHVTAARLDPAGRVLELLQA